VARNVEASKKQQQDGGADRRTAARIDLEIEVGLETESNFYTGLTQDISTGGLFVATHSLRKRGDRLMLKFSLPGVEAPFTVEGEVRWLREVGSLGAGRFDGATGMGLKFINLAPQAKAVIASFLKQRESIFYDDE
jgi:uncharacterized protein (TIGR02266 family)